MQAFWQGKSWNSMTNWSHSHAQMKNIKKIQKTYNNINEEWRRQTMKGKLLFKRKTNTPNIKDYDTNFAGI